MFLIGPRTPVTAAGRWKHLRKGIILYLCLRKVDCSKKYPWPVQRTTNEQYK